MGRKRSRAFSPGRRTSSLLLPRLVTRFRLIVRRIKTGKDDAALDLAHDPALVALVLGAFIGDEVDQVLWDQHRPVIVDHDDVIGKDRAPAAGDRLLPADEGQAVYRSWRGRAGAPGGQAGMHDPGLVAHDTVGDERFNAAP